MLKSRVVEAIGVARLNQQDSEQLRLQLADSQRAQEVPVSHLIRFISKTFVIYSVVSSTDGFLIQGGCVLSQTLQRELEAQAKQAGNQAAQSNSLLLTTELQSRLQALEHQLSEQCSQNKVTRAWVSPCMTLDNITICRRRLLLSASLSVFTRRILYCFRLDLHVMFISIRQAIEEKLSSTTSQLAAAERRAADVEERRSSCIQERDEAQHRCRYCCSRQM